MRYFECVDYLDQKLHLLNDYFIANKITGIVLGISGGVDSAVTLAIYREYMKRYPGVLKTLMPVIAPISGSIGTTEQDEAVRLARIVIESHEEVIMYDLGDVSKSYRDLFGDETNAILAQQVDYWLRPALLYGVAEKISQASPDSRVILSGTCNRSEWYTGYFSSYLDILAINPIIDLWKSGVYKMAEHLNVPREITDTPPKGGISNGNTDEQELGFTYNDLEDWYNCEIDDAGERAAKINCRYMSSMFKRNKFNKDWIQSVSVIL